MGRSIIKLTEGEQSWYMEWSSIVDAPVTYGMPLEEFREYYRDEYGRSGNEDLESRLKRVEEFGTSHRGYDSAEKHVNINRAGKNETSLTYQQVIEFYCKSRDESKIPVGKTWEELEND